MNMKLKLENRETVSIFGSNSGVGKTSVMLNMFLESYSSNNNEKTVIFTHNVKHVIRRLDKWFKDKEFNHDVNLRNIFIKHIGYEHTLDDIYSLLEKHDNSIVNIIIDDLLLKVEDLVKLRDNTNCKIISTISLNRDLLTGNDVVSLSQDVGSLIDDGVLETYLITKKEDHFNLKYNKKKEIPFDFDFDKFSMKYKY